MRSSNRIPKWTGVVLLLAVFAMLPWSCGCAVVRVAVEQGDGGQHADTGSMRTDLTADLDTDVDADVDGAALPLSELGGN